MKLFFLVLLSCVFFSSCGNSYENMLKNNTAEIRQYYMEGSQDNISASLVCGHREKVYIANGYATELIEFGVLTFVINDAQIDENLAQFELTVGTNKYSGDLQKNPFDLSYMADIKKIVDCSQNITATLILGDKKIDIKLVDVTKDFKIKTTDVYKLIAKKMKGEIGEFVINKTFQGEVYIKIINDADINVGDYYYYVCILGRNGTRVSAVVSPETSEILAINNLK